MWERIAEWTAEWRDLGTQCLDRFFKPFSRTTAAIYLVVAVAALGGLGLWASYILSRFGHAEPHEIALHATTYAAAIIVTSIGDLFLDRDVSIPLRFFLFSLALGGLALCGFLSYSLIFVLGEHATVSFDALVWVVVPVWLTWWLVNGSDHRFVMPPAPAASIGGDAGQNLND